MTSRLIVILNEVKNLIVTKGKPTAEILHFVQNVPMKSINVSVSLAEQMTEKKGNN